MISSLTSLRWSSTSRKYWRRPSADLEHAALGDRGGRAEQRVHGAVEVGDLAPQQVDAVGRRVRAGEDGVLDLLDVASRGPSTTGA